MRGRIIDLGPEGGDEGARRWRRDAESKIGSCPRHTGQYRSPIAWIELRHQTCNANQTCASCSCSRSCSTPLLKERTGTPLIR